MATLAQTKGGVKNMQGVLGHSKADTKVKVYMQSIEASVKPDTRCDLLGVGDAGNEGGVVKLFENLVRFGTVGFFDGLQMIESKGGRLTQR